MCGGVVDGLGEHGADDADIIGDLGNVLEHLADLLAGCSMAVELEVGGPAGEFLSLELGDGLPLGEGSRHGLAVECREFRLVVESFQVGWSPSHVKEDDSLDARTVVSGNTGAGPQVSRVFSMKKAAKGETSEPCSSLVQEGSTGNPEGAGGSQG